MGLPICKPKLLALKNDTLTPPMAAGTFVSASIRALMLGVAPPLFDESGIRGNVGGLHGLRVAARAVIAHAEHDESLGRCNSPSAGRMAPTPRPQTPWYSREAAQHICRNG